MGDNQRRMRVIDTSDNILVARNRWSGNDLERTLLREARVSRLGLAMCNGRILGG